MAVQEHPSIRVYLGPSRFNYMKCKIAFSQVEWNENKGWVEDGSHNLPAEFYPVCVTAVGQLIDNLHCNILVVVGASLKIGWCVQSVYSLTRYLLLRNGDEMAAVIILPLEFLRCLKVGVLPAGVLILSRVCLSFGPVLPPEKGARYHAQDWTPVRPPCSPVSGVWGSHFPWLCCRPSVSGPRRHCAHTPHLITACPAHGFLADPDSGQARSCSCGLRGIPWLAPTRSVSLFCSRHHRRLQVDKLECPAPCGSRALWDLSPPCSTAPTSRWALGKFFFTRIKVFSYLCFAHGVPLA